MTLNEQIVEAVNLIKSMFNGASPHAETMPEDASLESLWKEVLNLRKELQDLRKVKRGVKPKVEDAVRAILEDERLVEIPITMIAEIIQKVFTNYGVACSTTEKSIRWYMSQRNLEWKICRRQMPRVSEVKIDESA